MESVWSQRTHCGFGSGGAPLMSANSAISRAKAAA